MVLKIVVFNLVGQKKHHDETNFDSIFANRILYQSCACYGFLHSRIKCNRRSEEEH